MPARKSERRETRLSRALSYALRHAPQSLGIVLDGAGFAHVDRVLEGLRARGDDVSRDDLVALVRASDKQRFALSDDGRRIRAVQGHSVTVDLGYASAVPPESLFHGTVASALAGIAARGLRRGRRHHVHLSADRATATVVGARRGIAVVLSVDALAMHENGFVFYRADNGVWLTDHVPPAYLRGLRD